MGQLLNKADGIGDRHATATGQTVRARCRIERGKQLILRKYRGSRQTIKQRRLAGIGVASQRNAKRWRFNTAFRLHIATLLNLFQFASKRSDLIANQTTVDLELAFALAKARANTATRLFLGKVAPHTSQTRQQVLQLCQLHLQAALTRLGMQTKDIQNQRRTVNNLDRFAHGFLKIGLL